MGQPSIYWQRAIAWGLQNYPNAPEIHHEAFASVIQFACTFKDRRSVIETMRTLVAVDILHHQYSSPIKFEQAVELLSEVCYGHITIAHAQKYKHNRPEGEEAADIQAAQRFIEQFSKILISNIRRDQ